MTDDFTRRLVDAVRTGGAAARAGLANHPLLPEAVLGELVADSSAMVRMAAATSPVLTAEQAAVLGSDADVLVRRALLAQPLLPEDVLVALAGDSDAEVRRRAADHAGMPPGIRALVTGLEPKPDRQWARAARAAQMSAEALEGEGLGFDERMRRMMERMREAKRDMRRGVEQPVAPVDPEWDWLIPPHSDEDGDHGGDADAPESSG